MHIPTDNANNDRKEMKAQKKRRNDNDIELNENSIVGYSCTYIPLQAFLRSIVINNRAREKEHLCIMKLNIEITV